MCSCLTYYHHIPETLSNPYHTQLIWTMIYLSIYFRLFYFMFGTGYKLQLYTSTEHANLHRQWLRFRDSAILTYAELLIFTEFHNVKSMSSRANTITHPHTTTIQYVVSKNKGRRSKWRDNEGEKKQEKKYCGIILHNQPLHEAAITQCPVAVDCGEWRLNSIIIILNV